MRNCGRSADTCQFRGGAESINRALGLLIDTSEAAAMRSHRGVVRRTSGSSGLLEKRSRLAQAVSAAAERRRLTAGRRQAYALDQWTIVL